MVTTCNSQWRVTVSTSHQMGQLPVFVSTDSSHCLPQGQRSSRCACSNHGNNMSATKENKVTYGTHIYILIPRVSGSAWAVFTNVFVLGWQHAWVWCFMVFVFLPCLFADRFPGYSWEVHPVVEGDVHIRSDWVLPHLGKSLLICFKKVLISNPTCQ